MGEREESIHTGHRDRLRRRLRAEGMASFTEHEVLELLLMYAIPQRDVNPLAHALIERFGSLAAVLEADESELMRVRGVGEHAAMLLSMMPALIGRYHQSKLGARHVVTNPAQAHTYCRTLFAGVREERLYAICLDKAGHVIHPALMAQGTLDEVRVYPRQLVEIAVRYHAYNLLLAHNHPGGHCAASQSDIDATLGAARALQLINVNIVDHIVICSAGAYSMMHRRPVEGENKSESYLLRSPGPADKALKERGALVWCSMLDAYP